MRDNDKTTGSWHDVGRYASFFRHDIGGAWHHSEFSFISTAITKDRFLRNIEYLRKRQYDYLIFIYSGHGCTIGAGDESYICLDSGGELSETSVWGISQRQLTIFDSCRQEETEDEVLEETDFFDGEPAFKRRIPNARARFEHALIASKPCQYRLYACSLGESADATLAEGGVFSRKLIEATMHIATTSLCPKGIVRLGDVFPRAKRLTRAESPKQNPEIIHPQSSNICHLPWALSHRRSR